MEKLKNFFLKFYSGENKLQITIFNIIVGGGIAAGIISLAVTIIIGIWWLEALIIAAAEALLITSFFLANKYGRLDLSVIIVSVGISLLIFPLLFFIGGGVNSGMPFWFVMGIIAVFLLTRGKTRIILVLLDIIAYSVCFLIDYNFPRYVVRIDTVKGVYMDKWQSMVVLALVVGIILCFQNKVHMQMHQKDIMQKQELDKARKEAEKAKEAYLNLAYTDIMTDVRNRTAFENHMEQIRKKEQAHGMSADKSSFPVIILMADLNSLKHINDTFGHEIGDNAICDAARLLKNGFEGVSSCYRIGGDEFCVISESMSESSFEKCFEKFETDVEEYSRKTDYNLSIAAGYAVVGKAGVDEAYKNADRNMYERKLKMKCD